jgi:hypothetical protein
MTPHRSPQQADLIGHDFGDEDSRARFAARGIRIIDTPITEVVNDNDGALAGCAWPTARSWPAA